MTADEERDDETRRWNAALAAGDRAEIERIRVEIMAAVCRRIMNDEN